MRTDSGADLERALLHDDFLTVPTVSDIPVTRCHWCTKRIRRGEPTVEIPPRMFHDYCLAEVRGIIADYEAKARTACPMCNDTGVRSYHSLPGPYGVEPCSFCDPNDDPNEE